MPTPPRKPRSSSPLSSIKTAVKEAAKEPEQVPVAAAPAHADEPPAPEHKRVVDERGRSYATGRRKNAIARVWIKPGSGKITVNGREVQVYFARPVLQMRWIVGAGGCRQARYLAGTHLFRAGIARTAQGSAVSAP
jgi:hypothetical protein